MQTMTPAEARAFLSAGTRTGKLATTRADGSPHIAPIWFVLDGDDVIFTTWHTSVKARNLQRSDRAALCVDLPEPPYAFVIVEGRVTLGQDSAELALWAYRIAARYMGADQADAYGRRNSVPGELLLRLTPIKIIAQDNVSGW